MSVTSTRLQTRDIDRATGTRLGTLWALPVFGVVLPGVVLTPGPDLGSGTRRFWIAVATICWACFAWAWLERSRARRFVRFLHARVEGLRTDGVEYDGVRLVPGTLLVQYASHVSLLLIEVELLSAPRVQGRALVPNLVTLLLGWWALPWGPLHTVRTLLQNARGGRTMTVQELLAALSVPAAPEVRWWRRLLALDSGNNVQIILNIAVAIMLLALGSMIAFAIVTALLHGPG